MPTLHLIPTPIAKDTTALLPEYLQQKVRTIKIWYVEELKTARRFLKSVDKQINIDELTFYILNENDTQCLLDAPKVLQANDDIGLMSEAGCPAVADPGSALVAIAHNYNIKVIPYIGPSSLLLALMASGLNGQQFKFNGYLPVKNPERSKALQRLETESRRDNCTQIFIETPYRNNVMVDDMLKTLQPNTLLCIAIHINGTTESIITRSIKQWQQQKPTLPKAPSVFLILSA